MPPMLEKEPTLQGKAIQWRNKGAFEQSVLQSNTVETRVDIFRLIITLLAINLLPAVALWRYNAICDWLQSHQGEIRSLSIALLKLIAVLVLIGVGLADIRESATRLKSQSGGS